MTKQTLFTQKDCVPLPSDLVGEILVLRTDFFFDEYKRPEYQLVYFEHDYKKSDNVFCRFLIDREKSDYQPSDFIGVLKPELVPNGRQRKSSYYKPQRTRSEGGCTVSRQIRKERSLFI